MLLLQFLALSNAQVSVLNTSELTLEPEAQAEQANSWKASSIGREMRSARSCVSETQLHQFQPFLLTEWLSAKP